MPRLGLPSYKSLPSASQVTVLWFDVVFDGLKPLHSRWSPSVGVRHFLVLAGSSWWWECKQNNPGRRWSSRFSSSVSRSCNEVPAWFKSRIQSLELWCFLFFFLLVVVLLCEPGHYEGGSGWRRVLQRLCVSLHTDSAWTAHCVLCGRLEQFTRIFIELLEPLCKKYKKMSNILR